MLYWLLSLFVTIPVWLVSHLIIAPVYALFYVFTLPLRHMILYCRDWLVFLLEFASSYESLFIYIGCATFIGTLTGGVLFIIWRFVVASLNLDRPRPEDEIPSPPRRSIQEYRKQREMVKSARATTFPSTAYEPPLSPFGERMIMEESEESDS